ncbi:hypothetical protein ACFYRC_29750 [Streptomyces sp. NPDC005279]|uniref:hypothetical protein n=1 Tax=Streptomyces sp. NPDC005279 TaxID=3364712 RepID=UPI0036B56DD8
MSDGPVQKARRTGFTVDRSRRSEVTKRFFDAATGGDINTLMELLSPDVSSGREDGASAQLG